MSQWGNLIPTAASKWRYCFSVWPDEEYPRWRRPVFDLFRMMAGRIEDVFTEREFNDFREELAKCGISLREIERIPHFDAEVIL